MFLSWYKNIIAFSLKVNTQSPERIRYNTKVFEGCIFNSYL